jgi:ribosomal protein S16
LKLFTRRKEFGKDKIDKKGAKEALQRIVTESRVRRDGLFIETMGTYDPMKTLLRLR